MIKPSCLTKLPAIYHPIYSDFPLPDGHRYPLQKYRLLKEHIEEQKWPVELLLPSILPWQQLTSQHCPRYVSDLVNGQLPLVKMRRIGFPWSEALVQRSLTSLGGTLMTVDQAEINGIAIHLTGGYHHAHYDFGSGFCMFNDLILAARHALTKPGMDKVMIIDCDVHHGDGTATMAQENEQIVTLSIHCEKNFPSRKPDSDFDLALPTGTTGEDYLRHCIPVLEIALAQHQPDFVIYDAGVDIHADDELGYFNVSQADIYRRDHAILSMCNQHQIPVAVMIGGGYHSDQTKLVPLHAELLKAALDVFTTYPIHQQ